MSTWWILAVLSAVCAGAVAVLAKAGLGGTDTIPAVNSNLATAIRMLVILPMAWIVVFFDRSISTMGNIHPKQWIFLLLSGVATGLSWLLYFAAIAKAPVTQVAPIDKSSLLFTFLFAMIFLGEKLSWQTLTAGLLVLAAMVVMLIK